MIKVGLLGANGRMGQAIIQVLKDHPTMMLEAAHARRGTSDIPLLTTSSDVFPLCDVVIDFTKPHALEAHLDLARHHNTPMVVGTTGLSDLQKSLLVDAAQVVPLVYAENFSMGAVLMTHMARHMAQILDENYDIEISETHHRHKIDSPSGTSLALGRAVARGRNIDFDQHAIFHHQGLRQPGAIGFAVQRGGTVVGEHTLGFLGPDECLSITHRGFSRQIYAQGALKAAQWLQNQEPGLYSMQDVLNLHALFKH